MTGILFIFQSALASVVHLPDEEILVRKALGSMLEIFNQTLFVELTVKEVLWGYDNKLIGKANQLLITYFSTGFIFESPKGAPLIKEKGQNNKLIKV